MRTPRESPICYVVHFNFSLLHEWGWRGASPVASSSNETLLFRHRCFKHRPCPSLSRCLLRCSTFPDSGLWIHRSITPRIANGRQPPLLTYECLLFVGHRRQGQPVQIQHPIQFAPQVLARGMQAARQPSCGLLADEAIARPVSISCLPDL